MVASRALPAGAIVGRVRPFVDGKIRRKSLCDSRLRPLDSLCPASADSAIFLDPSVRRSDPHRCNCKIATSMACRCYRPRLLVWCLALLLGTVVSVARGQPPWAASAESANPYSGLLPAAGEPYPTTDAVPVVTQWPAEGAPPDAMLVQENPNHSPTSATWIVPEGQPTGYVDADVYCDSDPFPQQPFVNSSDGPWYWQVLPDGLIYHSYWAGVHEPRLGIQLVRERDGDSFWDPTLGARVGLLRFGNGDPLRPQGWQLDAEGAAMPRLTLDRVRDLETVDFRGGVPLTYGIGDWQFKLGYYHLSSHLGDEYAISHPGSLADRINYVRDSLVLGASYYPVPVMRIYSEAGYALNATDGAEPWEFQFGTELSQPGVTGVRGTPFVALNGHLREEHNFGGDFTAEAGWLWRGVSGQVMRIGAFYFNGKSSQYQTFDNSEEQIGVGFWYDF